MQKCIRDSVIPIAQDYFIEIYRTLRALGQTKKRTTLKIAGAVIEFSLKCASEVSISSNDNDVIVILNHSEQRFHAVTEKPGRRFL